MRHFGKHLVGKTLNKIMVLVKGIEIEKMRAKEMKRMIRVGIRKKWERRKREERV